MARARKRHIQQQLFRHGGKRTGAGRKQTLEIKSAAHRTRPLIKKNHALHITLRPVIGLGRLRRRKVYAAVRRAANIVLARTEFRVVHISIQANHIHLIVEAGDKTALAAGMKAFQVSAARKINAALGRNGQVFPDRYHLEVITSPRQARNALAYVLNNWRRHREDRTPETRGWQVDPFATPRSFIGWREAGLVMPRSELGDEPPLPVARPETWLLREGWKNYGPISAYEVPGPRPSHAHAR